MKKVFICLAMASFMTFGSCSSNSSDSENSSGNVETADTCCGDDSCTSPDDTGGATITARGKEFQIAGYLPNLGENAPDATLTDATLEDTTISSYKGQTVILNIFPSIDTPTCSASVRHFNQLASEMDNVRVLCISMDLPFAAKRYCGAEGLNNVTTLSGFRSDFGDAYGVRITEGPMSDLYARAVIIINKEGKIAYTQLVSEISNEPDYDDVLNTLKSL